MPRVRSETSFLAEIGRKILVLLQTRHSPHPNLYRRHNEAYRTYIEFAQSQPAHFRADKSDRVATKASFGIPKQADLEKVSACKSTRYCAGHPPPSKHQALKNGSQPKRIKLIGLHLPGSY